VHGGVGPQVPATWPGAGRRRLSCRRSSCCSSQPTPCCDEVRGPVTRPGRAAPSLGLCERTHRTSSGL